MRNRWNLEPNEVEARLQSDWSGQWLVMRCGNNSTLSLALALEKIGVRAWTPLWVRKRRFPRSSNYRKVLMPCLPSFVFLAEGDLTRALEAAQSFAVPAFSLMNSYGILVRIRDSDLESLRKVADLNPRKVNPVVWPGAGAVQKVLSGAFQGMVGKVVGQTEHHCLFQLDEGKLKPIKIPPFLLSDVEA